MLYRLMRLILVSENCIINLQEYNIGIHFVDIFL